MAASPATSFAALTLLSTSGARRQHQHVVNNLWHVDGEQPLAIRERHRRPGGHDQHLHTRR